MSEMEQIAGAWNESFDLQEYLTKGVERVVAEALKATLKNPRESAFMLKFAAASRTASQKRKKSRSARGTYSALSDRQHYKQV